MTKYFKFGVAATNRYNKKPSFVGAGVYVVATSSKNKNVNANNLKRQLITSHNRIAFVKKISQKEALILAMKSKTRRIILNKKTQLKRIAVMGQFIGEKKRG